MIFIFFKTYYFYKILTNIIIKNSEKKLIFQSKKKNIYKKIVKENKNYSLN